MRKRGPYFGIAEVLHKNRDQTCHLGHQFRVLLNVRHHVVQKLVGAHQHINLLLGEREADAQALEHRADVLLVLVLAKQVGGVGLREALFERK